MTRIMLMNELHILHCLTMIWWLLGTYLRITACGHHTWSGVCARSDMDMSMCKHDSRREKHAANRGPGGPGAWVQSHKCWSWCSQFMSILGFVTSLSLYVLCAAWVLRLLHSERGLLPTVRETSCHLQLVDVATTKSEKPGVGPWPVLQHFRRLVHAVYSMSIGGFLRMFVGAESSTIEQVHFDFQFMTPSCVALCQWSLVSDASLACGAPALALGPSSWKGKDQSQPACEPGEIPNPASP